jgi:16S rRNA (cytosine1402-N4)-methyltransferase
MKETHNPVLLAEAINYLKVQPDGVYVDCTLGRGGHSAAILKQLTNVGQLYAFDQDPSAIAESQSRLAEINPNFTIIQGNFQDLASLLALKNVFAVDGILYDLGVSSPQFDLPERGFSYRMEGPLDMRMDQKNQLLTAADVVNQKSVSELKQIFQEYGEEKAAATIAKAIVANRPIQTTTQLVAVIKKGMSQKALRQKGHPAKKVFQALRIYVNDELNVLQSSLSQALKLLKPKGRLVVITFHSLEEKIVKETFKAVTEDPQDQFLNKIPFTLPPSTAYQLVVKKPIKPQRAELEHNPRAHSAKMWVIEKR